MRAQIQTQAGNRSAFALWAALAPLLCCTIAPPSAWAQEAFCGFSGVKNITVQQGQAFPLPSQYSNLTNTQWTFYIYDFSGNRFELPSEFMGPVRGSGLVLPPQTPLRTLPNFVYNLPFTTPVGTDRVVLTIKAAATFPWGSSIRDVATCEYNLTVTHSPTAPDGCFWTGRFSEVEGGGQKSCPGTIRRVNCIGGFGYCAMKSLECCVLPRTVRNPGLGDYWSEFFSEEDNGHHICAGGRYVQRVRCDDDNCNNLSVYCESAGTVRGSCRWTDFFSEEQGIGGCNSAEVTAGIRCRGSYCDDISLYCCRP